MEKATISEIKNHLSAYLKRVRSGESVLIFDRNQPVARLERVMGDEHQEGRLMRLERSGHLRRGTQSFPMELLSSPAPKSKKSVLQALLEERAEGR